ncbi:uncharacterized protein SCHCODRAFT_02707110 [Schizophyllum commune H4-8]|uniref:uncharacterized protein n=1 Tax=Schizophyllum commune (strain H4-8 / FGSC 9210) TaxID=578458 RepID=UPI00215E9DCA|nr:uncharacterized protein SCHCODRAFT_02707110 [Schizophyllum commune H4-8]KAI5885200.1 hypothetical protein SCHCODRAFT_02707110 [Schizophyllum commune H4-8]
MLSVPSPRTRQCGPEVSVNSPPSCRRSTARLGHIEGQKFPGFDNGQDDGRPSRRHRTPAGLSGGPLMMAGAATEDDDDDDDEMNCLGRDMTSGARRDVEEMVGTRPRADLRDGQPATSHDSARHRRRRAALRPSLTPRLAVDELTLALG